MEAIPVHALDSTAWWVIGMFVVMITMMAWHLLIMYEGFKSPEVEVTLKRTDTRSRIFGVILKITVCGVYLSIGFLAFALAMCSYESIAVLLVLLICLAHKVADKRRKKRLGIAKGDEVVADCDHPRN